MYLPVALGTLNSHFLKPSSVHFYVPFLVGKGFLLPVFALNLPFKHISERGFPGGPMAKISSSNAEGMGSVSDQGAKIPHASRPKNKL